MGEPGNPGGYTSFGDLVTALGGLGGAVPPASNINGIVPQPVVEHSATGGSYPPLANSDPTQSPYGQDGELCPFDLSEYPDLDEKKIGASGGFPTNQAFVMYPCGETGGGYGGYQGGPGGGAPGSFYGAGGGGGGSKSGSSGGGSGYQGILIIKY